MNLLFACIALAWTSIHSLQSPNGIELASSQEGITVRQQAWALHNAPRSGASLVEQWQQMAASNHEAFLMSASRGLRGQAQIGELLEVVLQDTLQDSSSLTAGLVELLHASPRSDSVIPLLKELHQKTEWHVAASSTLLRWGVLPTDPTNELAQDLLAQLQNNWHPPTKHYAAILGLGSEFRLILLPLICDGSPVSSSDLLALSNLDQSTWSPFDSAMIHLLALDSFAAGQSNAAANFTTVSALQSAWSCYLNEDLALGQRQLLESGIRRHAHHMQAQQLEDWIHAAEQPSQRQAMRFLTKNTWTVSASLLLKDALNSNLSIADRTAACQALFRCGSDADIQSLLPLLNQKLERTFVRALFAGWRLRPPTILPGVIEAKLPKLRTQEAVLAVELLILTTDHTTRVSWLKKTAALPPSSAQRIVQAAWAKDPHQDLLEVFWVFAKNAKKPVRELGLAGLRAALSEQEIADGYRSLLGEAQTPAQHEAYLGTIRDLRTDAALEILVDWLISDEGRSHRDSSKYASLLIEETEANRLFQLWWDRPAGLSESQLDWAACNLSPTLPAARQRLHQKFAGTSIQNKTMFLSRMQENPSAADVQLWKQLLLDEQKDLRVRRVAAHLLFRVYSDDKQAPHAQVAVSVWNSMLQSPPADLDRAWAVFVRGLAAWEDLEWRQSMLKQAHLAPTEIKQSLLRNCYQGFADAPLATQLQSLQNQLLDAAVAPGAIPFPATARPKHQEVSQLHFEFFHLLLSLKPFSPTENEDQRLANELIALGSKAHPDRLSLMATTLTSWPKSQAAAEDILLATEAKYSYRFPPLDRNRLKAPLSSIIDATPFFEEFRKSYDAGKLSELPAASIAALQRWPRDRRSHLWAGWLALSSNQAKEALAHYEQALIVSGWLPYAQLEPKLGLAVAHATLNSDWSTLNNFLNDNDQSDALLIGRTIHGLLPELSALAEVVE